MSIADKLTTIAENEEKVYQAGYNKAMDEFWESFQIDTGHRYKFAGPGWTDATFYPRHDIMLDFDTFCENRVTDLSQRLKDCGVKITKILSLYQTFYGYQGTTLPVLDLSNTSVSSVTITHAFRNAYYLKTIEGLVLTKTITFNNTFYGCKALENLTIEGEIGQNGLSLADSPMLSKASIESVVNHLSDDASGKSVTLNKVSVNNAFETSGGLADGTESEEWLALIGTKPNWTITLL